MRRVFVESGVWFGYVNQSGPDHWPVVELLDNFPGRLVTSTALPKLGG